MSQNPSPCPIERSDPIIGDRYIMRILRELFSGNSRFEEIQAQADITPQMASTRLKKMVETNLVERRSLEGSKTRYEYVLTERGRALYPVLMALREWGETWQKEADEPLAVRHVHKPCGTDPGVSPICPTCREPLKREDLIVTPSPEWKALREHRHMARFKGSRKPGKVE